MPRRGSTKHISRDYTAGRLESEVKQLESTSNGVFSDQEFPPTTLSLIDTREVPPFVLNVPKFSRHTAWKRAPEIHRDNLDPAQAQHTSSKQQLFTLENLHPTAVKQGGLENCYFLASLSSLSQSPDRVTRLFLPHTNPDLGIYAVRLFANGAPKEVVVDDYLPIEKQTDELPRRNPEDNLPKGAKVNKKTKVDNGDGTSTVTLEIEHPDGRMQIKKQTMDNDAVATKLKFSRTTTDELWVPILEKAYAKVHGSYAALEAGCHFDTIRDLTGAPGFYWMTVEDSHWPMMERFYHLKYPMSCGIDFKYNMPWSQQDLQNAGLVPMHVYSILGVCTVQASGKQQRLIKLRNPWGDAMEWTGNWSARSPMWTSAVRKQIQNKGIPLEDPAAQDGIFWMPFEDFRRFFNSWDVNKYHDSYQFSAAILQNHPPGYHLVTVHVQQAGPYTFGVSQTSNRMMPTSARYKYSSVRAIMVKARRDEQADDDDRLNGCQFLKGVVGENRDEYIEFEHLEPGMYYLFVQVSTVVSSQQRPVPVLTFVCLLQSIGLVGCFRQAPSSKRNQRQLLRYCPSQVFSRPLNHLQY
jgi:Calpain family cysteine protease